MSEKSSTLKQIRNSAIIKNPLLFEAIGLCVVIAIARTLKTALFLACVTAVEMIVCEVLASLLLKNVKRYWRVALYVIFGASVVFSIMYLTEKISPKSIANSGVFLPLMTVNSLIALHCERVAVKNNVKNSFIDAVSASLSYGAVALVLGLLREILGYGTIWNIPLNISIKIPAFLMPFGGLLLIGFLAAILKAYVNKKYPNASPDKSFDTSEIRRSLRGPIKELMKDEFNPYEDGDEVAPNVRERKKKLKNLKQKTEEAPKPVEIQETREFTTLTAEGTERTYLDEFSEILSELEDYKNKNNGGEEK